MRPAKIFHLDSYRERKETRLRQTLALHDQDPERSRILLHLWRALALVGGDRGAVVWLDDYGPGLAHAHVLLDLASDRPRRLFSPEALRGAWDAGVPGLLDMAEAPGRAAIWTPDPLIADLIRAGRRFADFRARTGGAVSPA